MELCCLYFTTVLGYWYVKNLPGCLIFLLRCLWFLGGLRAAFYFYGTFSAFGVNINMQSFLFGVSSIHQRGFLFVEGGKTGGVLY